ncbi:Hypothetical protein CAP_3581 [Chondromyces apiculatus DSM 436]|uniref:Uncharacterized protein n=1 Tax=Chondromyces apiculatus DSM 436 TaxID=1192034 RepID=A0A017T9D4_9BACT|nr:Hypothetical protein CAP_3581 [Chondromyces apiculatus DSM 436]
MYHRPPACTPRAPLPSPPPPTRPSRSRGAGPLSLLLPCPTQQRFRQCPISPRRPECEPRVHLLSKGECLCP